MGERVATTKAAAKVSAVRANLVSIEIRQPSHDFLGNNNPLCAGPNIRPVGLNVHHRIHGLHWRVREIGCPVVMFDHPGRGRESCREIALFGRGIALFLLHCLLVVSLQTVRIDIGEFRQGPINFQGFGGFFRLPILSGNNGNTAIYLHDVRDTRH